MKTDEKNDGTEVTPEAATADAPTRNPVVVKLRSLSVGDEIITKIEELGVESLDDLTFLSETDLVGIGMKPIPAKRLLASLKEAAPATNDKSTVTSLITSATILPQVPDNVNLLAALKAGGVLKVGETEVISAIKAGLYSATRLDEVPKLLTSAMKTFARAQKEQVSPHYRKMKKVMARRSYAEVLAALEGAEGVTTVPKEDKDWLLEQVLNTVFPALASYQFRLSEFVTEYRKTGFDPMLLLQAIGGGVQNALMGIAPPDLGVLHDSAETVIESINGAFAGDGCIAARALAFDAIEVVQTLKEPGLPMSIGAASYEHMLRELGIDVSADFERLERSVPQYALAIMKFNSGVTPGSQEELGYVAAMNQLGSQIPWDLLTKKKVSRRPAGIGGHVNREDDDE